jgi:hypothetical protein
MRLAHLLPAFPLLASALGAQGAPLPPEWAGPPGSSRPSLAKTPTGELLLSWLEPLPGKRTAVRLATTDHGRWDGPVTAVESDRVFVNWADFPSAVETTQGAWVVHWLEKTEAKPYAYHVRITTSRDRGRTWSAPVTLHQDRSPTEHGFVAMVPQSSGRVAVAWLDGRQMVDSGGAMSARVATIGADGVVRDERLLDARTCECCQLAMTEARSGLVAVYRDRSEQEVRDIAIVRQINGRWSAPKLVAADGWIFRACPVNGPSVSAIGDHLGVAWFTGAGGSSTVKAALSTDGGATFGGPIRVDQGNPLGRLHFQMISPERGAVVWLELRGKEASWMLRTVGPAGAERPVEVAGTSRARDAGFPRIAQVGETLFVAYAEAGSDAQADGRVRVRKVALGRR